MTTATVIPTNAAELEEMLGDPSKVNALMGEGRFKDVIEAYARVVVDKDQSIATQVREEVQRVTAAFLKDNGAENVKRVNLDPNVAPTPQNRFYNPKAPGAAADKLFQNMAEFLSTTHHKSQGAEAMAKRAELEAIRNSYGSVVPADGGFLIPEYLRSELLRVSLEKSIVRSRARVIPMESQTVPFPTIDSTSNASSVYGGIAAYWTEEAGALVESQAKFGRVKLEAKKLTAYAEVPNELYSDSLLSLAAFIDQTVPEAVAFFEDYAFMNGSGVGEPLGFFKADAQVTVAKESGQANDTIKWENIVKMYARMIPASLGNAVWIVNQEVFPQLATMSLTVGTGGSAIWLNNGVTGPPMTILGRPVLVTEKAGALGDINDINFVDLSYYLIGDRQTMQAEASPHYKFGNDKTAIRFIERVDGRPWLQSAITPKKGTNTLSPFVALQAR
ncbi:phage major capsid protein [Streptomyces sp. NBC_01343]|uniref:phage major capsid protein n=1 Tax=Streptomyces sp. NBC_01343 TaxID=2903832 RepID=UPI002E0F2F86|nr:phage major capsid protein [Streptomyces sp. NBC_01343]